MRQTGELIELVKQQTNLNTKVNEEAKRSNLRDRGLRDVEAFGNDEATWSEWALRFRALVKESSTAIFDALVWADARGENEILPEDLKLIDAVEGLK